MVLLQHAARASGRMRKLALRRFAHNLQRELRPGRIFFSNRP
jgi:hypothetical protein